MNVAAEQKVTAGADQCHGGMIVRGVAKLSSESLRLSVWEHFEVGQQCDQLARVAETDPGDHHSSAAAASSHKERGPLVGRDWQHDRHRLVDRSDQGRPVFGDPSDVKRAAAGIGWKK